MTEINASPLEPEAPIRAGAPRPRRSGWKRPALLGGALILGAALGAGGLAVAATAPGPGGWQGWHHGPRLERIQAFVERTLDSIGATSDQEAKIHDIIATNFDALAPAPGDRMEMRKAALDLLRAPTIDRAAVEKLRAEQVAKFDAKSKQFVDVVLKAADVLTPEQRVKLADRAEQMGRHGPWFGPGHHGPRPHGPGMMRGPGDDAPPPPDQGPADQPDKG